MPISSGSGVNYPNPEHPSPSIRSFEPAIVTSLNASRLSTSPRMIVATFTSKVHVPEQPAGAHMNLSSSKLQLWTRSLDIYNRVPPQLDFHLLSPTSPLPSSHPHIIHVIHQSQHFLTPTVTQHTSLDPTLGPQLSYPSPLTIPTKHQSELQLAVSNKLITSIRS